MIKELIEQASKKAGSQNKLAKALGITSGRMSEFKNYKAGDKRKPSEEVILELAEYVGWDKAVTLYNFKKEVEPEKASLWSFLLDGAPGGNRTHDPRLRRPIYFNNNYKIAA